MKIKIEKGIPIPPSTRNGEVIGVMRKMQIGNSVVVPIGKRMSWIVTSKVIGFQLLTRKISETEVRIWRVEKQPAKK